MLTSILLIWFGCSAILLSLILKKGPENLGEFVVAVLLVLFGPVSLLGAAFVYLDHHWDDPLPWKKK